MSKDNKEKYDEAEQDEKKYKEQIDKKRDQEIQNLSEEQKIELRKKYRQATVLCHPDKFVNEPIEIQKQAEEIFKELTEANEKNDIERVSQILANLEKGILSTEKGSKITDKDRLRATIIRLKEKVKKLENELMTIKQSETYNTIINIKNLDEYFSSLKEKLNTELDDLKLAVESASQ